MQNMNSRIQIAAKASSAKSVSMPASARIKGYGKTFDPGLMRAERQHALDGSAVPA
jgi:hypothetical protein